MGVRFRYRDCGPKFNGMRYAFVLDEFEWTTVEDSDFWERILAWCTERFGERGADEGDVACTKSAWYSGAFSVYFRDHAAAMEFKMRWWT